jgi:hypothetical protein
VLPPQQFLDAGLLKGESHASSTVGIIGAFFYFDRKEKMGRLEARR